MTDDINAEEPRVEKRAIQFAKKCFERRNFNIEDVSCKRGHNGYDLYATKGDQILRIEVKGCTREWKIPDLFETEFDDQKRLVADSLCVVYFVPAKEPFICLIPRNEIPPEYVKKKIGYRISEKFKKRECLEKFITTC